MQYFGSYFVFLLFLLLRDFFFFFRLISGSMHKTLSCSLARGMTEMDYMTHTSIHPFVFSSSIPFIEAPLLENAKVYFHLTAEVYYSRQPQTCYIKTEGRKKGGENAQKTILVLFYSNTSTPDTSFGKVTVSKSSNNPCAIYLALQTSRATRCNKGGETAEIETEAEKERRRMRGRRRRNAMQNDRMWKEARERGERQKKIRNWEEGGIIGNEKETENAASPDPH